MALVPQTDDGTAAGANSYVALADFKTYHDDRGNTYAGFTDPQITGALIRATDYLDQRFTFIGIRLTTTQTTEWPRRARPVTCVWGGAFDGGIIEVSDEVITLVGPNGNEITGVPDAVKRAQFEYALRALSAPLFQDSPAPEGGQLITEQSVKVDVIEQSVKYATPQAGGFAIPVFPTADMWLARAGLIEVGRTLYR